MPAAGLVIVVVIVIIVVVVIVIVVVVPVVVVIVVVVPSTGRRGSRIGVVVPSPIGRLGSGDLGGGELVVGRL